MQKVNLFNCLEMDVYKTKRKTSVLILLVPHVLENNTFMCTIQIKLYTESRSNKSMIKGFFSSCFLTVTVKLILYVYHGNSQPSLCASSMFKNVLFKTLFTLEK